MVKRTILKSRCVGWFGLLPLVISCGCSAAYHDYPCGCVPYRYCPPPPMRYAAYDACPTPLAACYLENATHWQSQADAPLGEASQ